MIKVDARKDPCPTPVIKTKKAIDGLTSADTVEVYVDNETACENVSKYGKEVGGQVTCEKCSDNEYKITIKMSEKESREKNKTGSEVVVISSAVMGQGNDELGKVLMKGFIYALTQLDTLPDKILFYNGGATLTCEGSDSLEDLQFMEKEGVNIATCGTCLDYYQRKDKLQVGTVTNMYAILEAMSTADKILKP